MKSCDVNIGVLTVPINIAQEITDKMIAGGIKAVWNFTPFRIRVPEILWCRIHHFMPIWL